MLATISPMPTLGQNSDKLIYLSESSTLDVKDMTKQLQKECLEYQLHYRQDEERLHLRGTNEDSNLIQTGCLGGKQQMISCFLTETICLFAQVTLRVKATP